jgi:plastocyanin
MRPEGPVWQRRLMALRGMTCLALAWALPGSAAVVTNINIVDFAFQPSSVTVQVGDTVKWTWTGASSHSSTSDTSLWDSGVHGTGFVFTNSFAAAGNFPFHCSVHPFMTGSITVQAAATNSPPTIVTQPHSQAVAPGQDVTFTVSATGPPPLSFQWLFQGSEIVGATGSTLMLTNVQPAHAGSYSVVVNNSFGSVTSSPAVLTVSAATTALVTVHINGHGTVHPNYDGQMLNVGMTYSMTAVPAADSVFAGWTGSISSQSPTLNFLVQSNMVFQANFSPASSSGIPGAYYGLFYDTNGVALSSSGGFRLVTTSRGTFSGVLQTAAGRYACSGQFDANGAASGVPARHGMSSLSLDLQLDLSPGGDEITGTVTGGSFNALLVGSRAVYSAGSNPAPQAGRYTMIIPGDPGSVAEPGGDSIGLVTVTSAGRIRLSALLADGARASRSVAVVRSAEAWWRIAVELGHVRRHADQCAQRVAQLDQGTESGRGPVSQRLCPHEERARFDLRETFARRPCPRPAQRRAVVHRGQPAGSVDQRGRSGIEQPDYCREQQIEHGFQCLLGTLPRDDVESVDRQARSIHRRRVAGR